MSYVISIDPGTQRCRDFFEFAAGNKNLQSREWSENFGLKEAIIAGIDPNDYGWYIDDIQNALSIEEVQNTNGSIKTQFNITLNEISPETINVIQAISETRNTQGHSHINSAFYITEANEQIMLVKGRAPVPFEIG